MVRFLEYAKSNSKNLIEQRTIDELRATPLLIAALGGHLEVIEELINNEADLNAKLETTRHGVVEIAAIRQDIPLLSFLYDKVDNLAKKLRDLMISERVDDSSRITLGRTIEHFTQFYPKGNSGSVETRIASDLFEQGDFGACLATFVKLCGVENENALASAVVILVNLSDDETIRKGFINAKGVANLVHIMELKRVELSKRIELIVGKLKSNKSVDEFEVEDLFDKQNEDDDLDDSADNFLCCASIGQALQCLTRHSDCLDLMNTDGSNEKILTYIKLLFDEKNLMKVYQLNKMAKERKDNEGNSTKMKIFNIINMNKKKKEIQLTPSQLFLQIENPSAVKKVEKKVRTDDDDDEEETEEENEKKRLEEKMASRISFERYISSYIECVGSFASGSSTNKFYVQNLNLFELIICYWEQIMYFIYSSNRRFNFIIMDSICTAFEQLYSFSIDRSLFARKEENHSTGETSQYLFGPQKNKDDESFLANVNNHLLKSLKLNIIETCGQIINDNPDLKVKYYYGHSFAPESSFKQNSFKFEQSFDWIKRARIFLQTLLNLLDSSQAYDRELQLKVLSFLRVIVRHDLRMQEILIDTRSVKESHLTLSLRNLFLRKALPKQFTKSVLLCLWSMSNEDNFYRTFDRKCLIYRELGLVKVIDTFIDTEDPTVKRILLEGIACIASSAPRRTSSGQLVIIQQEIAEDTSNNMVNALYRYFRHASFSDVSLNETELLWLMRILGYMCMSCGMVTCEKSQLDLIKMNAIEWLIEISRRKKISSIMKVEAFLLLSLVTLKNFHMHNVYEAIFKPEETVEYIIKSLVILLLKVNPAYRHASITSIKSARSGQEEDENEETQQPAVANINLEEISEMDVQIKAGVTLCMMCYKNEEFTKRLIGIVGRINWTVYKYLIDKSSILLKRSMRASNQEQVSFNLQRLRCQLGFQVIYDILSFQDSS